MSACTTFKLDISEGIAHLCFNRPAAFNSMTREFWGEFPQAMADLSAGGEVRAMVISGEGKHFCAGMDLSVFTGAGSPTPAKNIEHQRRSESLIHHLGVLQAAISSVEDARFPVLAAIQGGCIGGAVDLATACDVRYAAKDAFVCIQETNIGLPADVGTLQRIGKVMSQGTARELAYTGRRMDAQEALQAGFYTKVFDTHEECIAHALEVAHSIAGKSPMTVRMTKEFLNYSRDHSVAESLRYQAFAQHAYISQADMGEALAAFQEKRDAAFDNLAPLPEPLGVVKKEQG